MFSFFVQQQSLVHGLIRVNPGKCIKAFIIIDLLQVMRHSINTIGIVLQKCFVILWDSFK